MAGLYRLLLGLGSENGLLSGGAELILADLPAAFVIGHRLQRAVFVGHTERDQTVVPKGLLSHALPVQDQLHRGGPGVDLHVGLLALAAPPAPAGHGVGHLPGAGTVLALVAQGTDRQEGALLQLKGHSGVQGLAQGLAGQVDAAGAGGDPAQPIVEVGRVVRVLPGADAHLAQIVDTGPDEVADQARLGFRQLPELVGVKAEGLGAQDQPVRVFLQVVPVALLAVVVAGDVHGGKGVPGGHVGAVEGGADLHEVRAHDPGQIVKELGAGGALLGLLALGLGLGVALGFLGGLLVGILAEADVVEEVEEDIDAAGHGPGVVQAVEELGHLLGQGDAPGLGSLGHLVAGGVEHHTGVVVILVHHIGQILPPPLVEVFHIVVQSLVDVPVVDVFVHYQHAQPVADLQRGLGAGVVGRAQGVVAVLLQNADPALQSVGMAGGAQQAVVVVDAGAPEDHTPAV